MIPSYDDLTPAIPDVVAHDLSAERLAAGIRRPGDHDDSG
jgi:hypothetical protein